MADPKISAELATAIGDAPGDQPVEVVVELTPAAPPAGPADRSARLAALRSGFESEAAAVVEAIRDAGGDVLGSAWLNQTVRARLPRRGLDALCRLGQVRRLDRPRPLRRDEPPDR